MPALLLLRALAADEELQLRATARSQKGEARLRDRARLCLLSHEGRAVSAIAARTGVDDKAVRRWITRFNARGMAGLADAPRAGRPATYSREEVGTVIATSLTPPQELGLPFGSWTLDRLAAYLQEAEGVAMKRSRIGELLQAEGLRWRTQESWFGARVDPAFAEKRGRSSRSMPRLLRGAR
jgi:transposase